MHNYDPINKYSIRTRLGNWSQEWDLEQTKRKEYLRRKHQGISTLSAKQKIFSKSLQSASITYSKDNFRKFGDHVMFFNGKVQGFLVTDIFEKQSTTEQSYNLSAVKNIHAAARSVFILQRANPNDGYKDNKIHFGQQIKIRINPLLVSEPAYLYSEPSSINRFSKVSRLQQVIFLVNNSHNIVWILQHPDPNYRLQSTGRAITCDQTVLIKHEMTNQWLAADNKTYQNAFGKQFQVMAHNFLVNSKSQNLIQQKRGKTTIDIPSRAQTDQNLWLILGASSPDQQFDDSIIKNEVVNKFTLQKKIKHLLTQRGVYGMRFLHKVFRSLDTQKIGHLQQNDFRWGLQSGKIFLTQQQLKYIIKTYNNKGLVSYKQLLTDLRGKMNDKRYQSIADAYKRAEKIISKKITLQQLGKIFDAKKYPQVLTKRKTQQQAFNEFIWSWDNIKPDYVIQPQQFAAYFQDLSCMIPRDQHFQYLLLSIFHF